jgi:hypothetical protein
MVIDEISWHTSDPHIVLVRRWDQENRADNTLRTLIDSLLEKLPEAGGDLRTITKALSAVVKEVPSRAMPVFKVSQAPDGYCAHYPQRPGENTCQFYKDTGHCRYASSRHFPESSRCNEAVRFSFSVRILFRQSEGVNSAVETTYVRQSHETCAQRPLRLL